MTVSCPTCGADLAETVIDGGVHVAETVLLAARARARARAGDTTPDAEAFPGGETPTKSAALGIRTPVHPIAERSDESQVTAERPHDPSLAPPPREGWSSSDPPTRMMRGTENHIELPSGSVVDDFEIEARLGEGAMGVVYGARHAKLGRRVALKVVSPTIGADPQALARFEREARALGSMHHPNIVDVFAFGALPDGRSYFAMEYLVGEALDARIARGRIPLGEALDVLDQIARGLESAHAQGVVHRDLKPSNIFLVQLPREQRSVVKLLDFGLAKSSVADAVERTASGAVLGTALYISPEQARGPDVDGRTDVYALGVIAYELVLGRHPFPEARTPTSAIAAHLIAPVPQPRSIWPGIPAALDLLMYAMLAKDPGYRPSLAQVRHVIASVRSQALGAEFTPHTASVNAGHQRVWVALLILLALFVGIVIGAGAIRGASSSERIPPSRPTITPIPARDEKP